MSGLPGRSEVVVVGGGVVGLSVAYELARRGREVLVLDRDDAPGVATRAAAGMLAPTSEADLTDRSRSSSSSSTASAAIRSSLPGSRV